MAYSGGDNLMLKLRAGADVDAPPASGIQELSSLRATPARITFKRRARARRHQTHDQKGTPVKNALRPPTTARLRVALVSLLGALAALALPALAQALPDGYTYEKVSPADKGNGEVAGGFSLTTGIKAAEEGDRILYAVDGAPAGATSFAQANVVFSERGTDSWGSHALTGILPFIPDPSAGMGGAGANPFPHSVSRDGSKTVLETNRDPVTGATVPVRVYLVDLPSATYERISPEPVAGEPYVTVKQTFSTSAGGTDDFSTLFFASEAQLTADAQAPGIGATDPKLYVHTDAGTTLASYLPGGTPTTGVLTSADPGETNTAPINGVSSDGSIFWWRDPRSSFSAATGGQLFRAEVGVEDSTFVNASENTTETVPGGPADFAAGSADGERAVFTSGQKLTDEASAGSSQNRSLFLYTDSADPENDQNLTLISTDSEPADGTSSLVNEVLGVSDDAKAVYFTASSQLVAGEPTDPGRKLYRWTQAGGLEYLLTAAVTAYPPGVTPDGRYLAFRSSASGITPEDNGGNAQAYLYDSEDGSVVCASCMPDGGTNAAAIDELPGSNIAGINEEARRMLSDDGRVIFITADRLLREDTNGKKDVYTYKDGQLDLISTGRATSDVRFGDATADGSRIYFVTREQLSGWDEDNKADMYVARIGDGLPEPDVRPESPCTGDDCQGPSPDGPDDEIGTGIYDGPGNEANACREAKHRAQKAQRRAKRANRAQRRTAQRAKRLQRQARRASGKRAKRLDRRADRQRSKAKRLQRKQRRLKRSATRHRSELRACRGQSR